MTWNNPVITGTESVAANKTYLNDNSSYIETKLQLDHYWDETAGLNGHHKYANMPKLESGGTPTDPTLPAGLDLNYYCKQKTSTESPTHQPVMPFTKDASGAVLELLGIRACAVFSVAAGVVTVNYKHNVTSVTRASEAIFDVVFPALPSNNYGILGGGLANSSDATDRLAFNITAATALGTTKSTTGFQIRTTAYGGNKRDPLQCWFVCFGG